MTNFKKAASTLLVGTTLLASMGLSACGTSSDLTSSADDEVSSDEQTAETSDTSEANTVWDTVTDAYIYAFPLVLEYATMQKMTNTVEATSTQAPANQFIHAKGLASADATDVVTPNVDTVYSQVWLDLSEDAVVIEKPATDRYCSVEVMDAYTNCVAILGTGGDTTDARTYIFTGPSYDGETPDGMTRISMPTNMGWIIVRTICDGEDDLENVYAIQNEMTASTLTLYENGGEPDTGTYDESNEYTPISYVFSLNASEYFSLANELMTDNPPADDDADIIAEIAEINVGAGLEFDADILGSDLADKWTEMLSGLTEKLGASSAEFIEENGIWSFYSSPIAEFGTEYYYRALIAVSGFGANPVSMAMYLRASADDNGGTLTGEKTYVLHFDSDELPPVEENGFWSITVYDNDSDALIANEINRYCVNDRSDVQYNEDGSLDIFLQAAATDDEDSTNWLPVGDGEFHLVLRIYLPSDEVQNGTWSAPTIECIE